MKTVMALFTCLLAASVCVATSPCANAAPPSPTFKTSFDCAQARASIEKLICRDPQLAQMDIELTRLYRLALTDEHSVPRPDKVMIDQQFWVKVRNQCASAPAPKAFRCTGFDALITATYFSTQPGVVYLKWANTSITLSQVPSDSGTQYKGKDYQGNYSFWQNDNVVLFQKPGSAEMSCTAEPSG